MKRAHRYYILKIKLLLLLLLIFSVFLKMSPLDPGGKTNTDPCGSGSMALVKRKLTEFVCPNVYLTVSHELPSKIQCFGSAYNIMRTRIQVQVKLHLEPDPDPEGKKLK